MATYNSPRELRTALQAHEYDWLRVLTPAQLDHPLLAAMWDGHTSLRTWLEDGAYTPEGARLAVNAVFAVIHELETQR